MQTTKFKIQYLPATILIVVGVLLWVLSLAPVVTAGTYAESAHGDTTNGINRPGTECPTGTPCPRGECTHCHDTFTQERLGRSKDQRKWNYSHINIDSKMPSQTVVQGLIYTLSYELVRKDGRWFVSSVSALEEEELANASKGGRVRQ